MFSETILQLDYLRVLIFIYSDLPGQEFWLGGEIVRKMPDDVKKQLINNEVNLRDNPQKLLDEVSRQFLGGE